MFKQNVFRKVKIDVLHNKFSIVIVVIFAFLIFSGSVINNSLRNGINNMEKRLGADIMIVPAGSKENAENMLLEGQRSTFYFDRKVFDTISKFEGVSEVTEQCFLKSMSADCCSSEVSIVFYDPDKDFILAPWIGNINQKKDTESKKIIVGYNVDVSKELGIMLFGKKYEIAGQMAKTGTSLDDSVYFSFDEMKDVCKRAEEKGAFLTDIQKKENIISSVYINIKDGYKVTDIVRQCHNELEEDFDTVFPKELTKALSKSYINILKLINIILFTGGTFLMLILALVNIISMNQRKREIALYRINGNSVRRVSFRILSEIILVNIIGAFVGCGIGILVIIPFGNYIGTLFDMPYLGPDFIGIIILTIKAIAIITLLGVVASCNPIYKVCKIEPYLALRKEGE